MTSHLGQELLVSRHDQVKTTGGVIDVNGRHVRQEVITSLQEEEKQGGGWNKKHVVVDAADQTEETKNKGCKIGSEFYAAAS